MSKYSPQHIVLKHLNNVPLFEWKNMFYISILCDSQQ
jgi:hypothetical protein